MTVSNPVNMNINININITANITLWENTSQGAAFFLMCLVSFPWQVNGESLYTGNW